MKKVLFLVSLALMLSLVISCPQPTDGGETPAPTFEDYTTKAETGSIGMKAIPGGEFARGNTDITASNFYLGKTEVTQAQWLAVRGTTPSNFTTDGNLPVENISWYDAIEFCNALTRAELTEADVVYTITKENETDQRTWTVDLDVTKKGYRLPTEAEWEYAAGGGESSARTIYAGTSEDGNDPVADYLGDYAWYNVNAVNTTHIVGTAGRTESAPTAKTGNANVLGLYDMSGNVWEWCWDWYVNPYDTNETDNPTGATSGSNRVYRGGSRGSWGSNASYCQVAYRDSYYDPSDRRYNLGLRVARSVAP